METDLKIIVDLGNELSGIKSVTENVTGQIELQLVIVRLHWIKYGNGLQRMDFSTTSRKSKVKMRLG